MQNALFSSSRQLWAAHLGETPVGPVWMAVSEVGLARVIIGAPIESSGEGKTPTLLVHALQQLAEYFRHKRDQFDLPIDWSGIAPFNLRALHACVEIPYGQVRTYAQLAEQLGNPRAGRAVGGAMAANPMPIIIPCHRVVGTDGKMHGYGAPNGIQTKAFLLSLEGGLSV